MNQIYLIIQREFRERVAKKSFIIVTLLMPLLMLAMMCLPAIIMASMDPDTKKVAVIDETGIFLPMLTDTLSTGEGDELLQFFSSAAPLDSAMRLRDVDLILHIPAGADTVPGSIALYSTGPESLHAQQAITARLEDILENHRINAIGIENLKEIMQNVKADITLQTYRIDKDSEEASSSSSGLSFGLGLGLSFILYMFLLIYGQMVMTSIIEEKNNRVLELVVTSVKPMHLMLGKIFGVASVAVVQILIWMVLLCCISAFVLPAALPSGVMEEVTALNAGTLTASETTHDLTMLQAVSSLGSVMYVFNLLFVMLLFLLLGFLFYASIFAAVGSAVDNVQDASQLQTVIIVPIILGLIVAVSVAGDPSMGIGKVCSYIPFTAPMVMMARVPFGVAAWEVLLSLAILAASFILTAWLAGKIYRVGIFMYGKKPTFKDLWRWSRQN